MNKQTSIIINVVLFIAIGVLYYLHFSSCNTACTNVAEGDAAKPVVMMPKEIKASKMVYINSDVLNKDYDFVKDLTSTAMAKQQRLQNSYEGKAKKLQEDYAEFQQKASQGLLSENQANAAQNELIKRKDELDQMEGQLQEMMAEVQKSNEEVRKSVIDYITEYNKTGQYNYIFTYTDGPGGVVLLANDSLDITKEIVEGLNAQYKAKKESTKKK
jgi:outer membrane protein